MARTSSQRHSTGEHAAELARWSGRIGGRIVRAWRTLPLERRWAAAAAVGLFLTLFLPWYQESVIALSAGKPLSVSTSVTGWAAFSFVEAAVLVVAAGVLTLLFQRAEGRAFHLPGGDGFVIMAAGSWTCVLVVWRIFDKQSATAKGPGVTTSGIEWGIFVALVVAGLLAYSGARIRAAHRPEPPLPGDDLEAAPQPPAPTGGGGERARPAAPRRVAEQPPLAQQPREGARAPGWLTAPPRRRDEDPTVAGDEQLTIPLEPGEQ